MRGCSRRAFSFLEVLPVIALLGFGAGILLPLVVRAREAAARTQSANNLRQIALAAHFYLDQGGSFPEGNDNKNFSATARLLPYLGQEALYKKIDFTKPIDHQDNAEARKSLVRIFLSPMDPQNQVNPKFGPTNYLFNAGSSASLDANDGVFFQNSLIRPQDLTDGFSNTLLAVETTRGDGGTKAGDVRRQSR